MTLLEKNQNLKARRLLLFLQKFHSSVSGPPCPYAALRYGTVCGPETEEQNNSEKHGLRNWRMYESELTSNHWINLRRVLKSGRH